MATFSKTLPVLATPDVLVCGAGCAGVGAAVAAARNGAQTLVVERCGFAGGFLTAVIGAGFDGLVDPRSGRVVVGGVALEMVARMGLVPGATDAAQLRGMRFTRNADLVIAARQVAEGRTHLCSDPEKFKLAADRILADGGARVLYHTQVVDVITTGTGTDARIGEVVVANKGGLGCIRPKMVVDCTGDGDVAAWAGAPFDLFERPQPMSLHFRIGKVPASPQLQQRCAEVLRRAHAAGRLGLYGGPGCPPLPRTRSMSTRCVCWAWASTPSNSPAPSSRGARTPGGSSRSGRRSCPSSAMGMGQAAGTAAAQAAAKGGATREVHLTQLQERLRAQGAILKTADR